MKEPLFKSHQPLPHSGDICRAGPSDFILNVTSPERRALQMSVCRGWMVRSEGGIPFQV